MQQQHTRPFTVHSAPSPSHTADMQQQQQHQYGTSPSEDAYASYYPSQQPHPQHQQPQQQQYAPPPHSHSSLYPQHPSQQQHQLYPTPSPPPPAAPHHHSYTYGSGGYAPPPPAAAAVPHAPHHPPQHALHHLSQPVYQQYSQQQQHHQHQPHPAAPASLYQSNYAHSFAQHPNPAAAAEPHQPHTQQHHWPAPYSTAAPPAVVSPPISSSAAASAATTSTGAPVAASVATATSATPSPPPPPPSVVLIGDRCARLWGMLWHPEFKLRLSIPDSVLFCNGAFHSYLFSSRQQRGEIRKKNFFANEANGGAAGAATASSLSKDAQSDTHAAPRISLETIRAALVRKAERDPSNVTPFVAVLQEHDARASCVKYHALPRVLRSMGALPESHRLAQASFAGVPQHPDRIDLYQLLRSYVHPLGGARYVTTYSYTPPPEHQHGEGSSGAGAGAGAGKAQHSIRTQAGRFTERYEVLPEERAFYDNPAQSASLAANGAEEKESAASFANNSSSPSSGQPVVAESILRECERMTLCVVEWLSRIHGVGVSLLSLEFVQNYSRKLVLHNIVDVQFLLEPALSAQPLSLGLQLLSATDAQGKDEWSRATAAAANAANGGQDSEEYDEHYDAYSMSGPSFAAGTTASSSTSTAASSRAQSRPASASVAGGGRAARTAARVMGNSASSAYIAGGSGAGAPPRSTQHSLSARPARPHSARPGARGHQAPHQQPHPGGASTARFSSDDVDEQLRSIHPPRGLVGLGSSTAGALAALPRQNKEKSKRPALTFDTLMQWETRTEVDERLSAGGVHPSAVTTGSGGAGGGGKDASGRADFLLFHWRQQAREGHAEVVRLNAELETASKSWAAKESQLMALLHMEEKKVALLSAQNQSGQVEIEALKQSLDESRLASAEAALEAEGRDKQAAKDREVSALLVARLEEQVRKLQDELLQTAAEKNSGSTECAKLRKDMSEATRLRLRAETELATAHRVRDELLEKLESEEKFARNLAQQLDLMADWDAFEDMRHLMTKASGLARNEGNRLKEMEALRAQVVRYTKDKGWQEKKASITRQAKAIKKSHAAAAAAAAAAAGGGSGAGGGKGASSAAAAHQDPIPERRATDVIYERALNRMAH